MTQWSGRDFSSILRSARAGHAGAIDRLLARCENYLRIVARMQVSRQLRTRVSASDVVQETMVNAWHGLPGFRGTSERELVAWTRRILMRAVQSAVEREMTTAKRDVRREVGLDEGLVNANDSDARLDVAFVSRGPSPSRVAMQREHAVLVADHLAKLSPKYREVIIRRNLQGMDFESIAPYFGTTPGATRALWLRALMKLQVIAAADGGEPPI